MKHRADSIQRPKVLFVGHDFKFLTPFIERCRQRDFYEVRLEKHRGHTIESESESRANLEWADIIFCEWALGNAVWYSKRKQPHQLLVVRLHFQEVDARDRIKFIWEIDWSRVDHLITITHHIYDWIVAEFPDLRSRTSLIYNPIDACGRLNRLKPPGHEFFLGLVGIVPQRKRLDLAIDILERLLAHDPRYRLIVKGHKPDHYPWMRSRTEEMAWYEKVFARIRALPFPDAVVFEPFDEHMADFYSRLGFILSTSDCEGSHQAVAEGMAAGCIPVIRHWVGADRIYPSQYVFDSVDEAVERILEWSHSPARTGAQDACRRFAQERFDQSIICDKMEALFVRFLGERRSLALPAALLPIAESLPRVMILAYIPPGYRGGYRVRVETEIRMLIRHGCTVHLACLHPPGHSPAALEAHTRQFERLGCRVHLIESPAFFDIKPDAERFETELTTLERLMTEHRIALLHAEALYCARMGALLKRRLPDLRLVFDVHGDTVAEERLSGSSAARIDSMANAEKMVFRHADLNVFVSEAMRRHFSARIARELPSVIVPCGITDTLICTEPATRPFLLPADRPVLVYLGTAAAWQCIEETIALFANLRRLRPDLFFLFITPVSDHAKVRAAAERKTLPHDNVLVIEVIHEKVIDYLRYAHVGFLLRHEDDVNRVSSPTKLGEYLASGCPVVLTDHIGDASELVRRHNVGIVIDPHLLNGSSWPERELRRILDLVERSVRDRKAVARRCRDIAWEHLLWEPATERLIREYRVLLSPSGSGDSNVVVRTIADS